MKKYGRYLFAFICSAGVAFAPDNQVIACGFMALYWMIAFVAGEIIDTIREGKSEKRFTDFLK